MTGLEMTKQERLTDSYGRAISYLRISVTDLCNLRCVYCMPQEGVEKHAHARNLSLEEIVTIAQVCVSLGVDKIRLTGGEPLSRRGILSLCKQLKTIRGLKELAMTTNASMLARPSALFTGGRMPEALPEPEQADGTEGAYTVAGQLKEAGVDRLNISLDTLREDRFRAISRIGTLPDVLSGIRAAKDAGFTGLKYNVVLMGGVNDDEIPDFIALTKDEDCTVRFIELMPVGETVAWDEKRFLPAETVLERCPQLIPAGDDGVSQTYRIPRYRGKIGLIQTMSEPFCAACNRMRLTSDGMLKPCLHRGLEVSLRGLQGGALEAAIREAVLRKPAACGIADAHRSESRRAMYAIGG